MKKSTLFFLSSLGLFVIYGITGYAGIGSCKIGYVHCAYETGAGGLAKWVKLSISPITSNINTNSVICFPSGGSFSLDQIVSQTFSPGNIRWTIIQCADPTCTQNIPLATDSFELTKNGNFTTYSTNPVSPNVFTANPLNFSFALNNNFGQNCSFTGSMANVFLSVGH